MSQARRLIAAEARLLATSPPQAVQTATHPEACKGVGSSMGSMGSQLQLASANASFRCVRAMYTRRVTLNQQGFFHRACLAGTKFCWLVALQPMLVYQETGFSVSSLQGC